MKRFYLIILTLVVALLITLPPLARSMSAPTASSYDLSWYTTDGGGATFSTGGGYSLGGTIGQPDAGSLSGGSYTLNGGFWGGAVASYKVYLPVILR